MCAIKNATDVAFFFPGAQVIGTEIWIQKSDPDRSLLGSLKVSSSTKSSGKLEEDRAKSKSESRSKKLGVGKCPANTQGMIYHKGQLSYHSYISYDGSSISLFHVFLRTVLRMRLYSKYQTYLYNVCFSQRLLWTHRSNIGGFEISNF